MTAKRPNLAALADAAGSTRAEKIAPKPMPAPEAETIGATGQGAKAPSRIGQKPITGFFDEDVRVQLKMLAAEQRRPMEHMIGEALNDLFAKYGKPEIVSG